MFFSQNFLWKVDFARSWSGANFEVDYLSGYFVKPPQFLRLRMAQNVIYARLDSRQIWSISYKVLLTLKENVQRCAAYAAQRGYRLWQRLCQSAYARFACSPCLRLHQMLGYALVSVGMNLGTLGQVVICAKVLMQQKGMRPQTLMHPLILSSNGSLAARSLIAVLWCNRIVRGCSTGRLS